ncbi:G-protein coupled receptors family 1 profile domain-containing protein [Caenorhabditis elegans]|uniref:G-protein coupled receptors family 1 profile domain-containing protein n=1 Tax=Caenorhabditis elegans TaxID=6239 RepID=A0A0M7REP9_CAEEL|nr:G-protein coupled receptors family 1 profile domain-containing protein [Caenorhabditis elegans]CUR30044.1 G-protein coupled receptors family 1 profile domain-containing protein [Caenorhabditis elegans]|eukprot:NP_001303745.1 Serpentine Receptor, class W [Caenorhabditis elegans]
MSTCNAYQRNYPGYDNATAIFLCQFEARLFKISGHVFNYEHYLSIASIFINIFHFLILIRKPLRSSSINIIMAFISIFDICSMLFRMKQSYGPSIEYIFDPCMQSKWYFNVYLEKILLVVKDHSQRSSTWLLFSIALIRTLVIRNPMNPKYERLAHPPTSLFTMICINLIFGPISIATFFGSDITSQNHTSSCDPDGVLFYYLDISASYKQNDGMILKIYTLINSVVSTIIPCFIFPIVTVFLVKELWKAEANRKRLFSSKKVNDSSKNTQLVLFLTCVFFIAQFPIGISIGASYFFSETPGFMIILHEISYIFSVILVANTFSHFFICIFMSSQYRAELKKSIYCRTKAKMNGDCLATGIVMTK